MFCFLRKIQRKHDQAGRRNPDDPAALDISFPNSENSDNSSSTYVNLGKYSFISPKKETDDEFDEESTKKKLFQI